VPETADARPWPELERQQRRLGDPAFTAPLDTLLRYLRGPATRFYGTERPQHAPHYQAPRAAPLWLKREELTT